MHTLQYDSSMDKGCKVSCVQSLYRTHLFYGIPVVLASCFKKQTLAKLVFLLYNVSLRAFLFTAPLFLFKF